jgi:DNA repair protein RecN (Recombination protein N)
MLKQLSIHNFVLFTQCTLTLTPGLNVITGETGAGKSLLLQAIDLVTGARADAKALRKGADKAQIIAEFSPVSKAVSDYVGDVLSIEMTDSILLRRVIQADGKSKAFINDVAVTQSALKTVGSMLIERYGQHAQRGLSDAATHRALIDAAMKDQGLLKSTQISFQEMDSAKKYLISVQSRIEQAQKERVYLQMIVEELGKLNPEENEETALQAARTDYMAMQKNQAAWQAAIEILEGAQPVSERLVQAQKQLGKTAEQDSIKTAKLVDALERAFSDVQEVSACISEFLHQPQQDKSSLAAKEDRLFALRDMARKYRINVGELAGFYQQSAQSLSDIENAEANLKSATKKAQETEQQYIKACDALREARQKTADSLIKKIEVELKALNMADAQLRLVQTPLPQAQWGKAGDALVFFEFAPNKGQGFSALSKIASGGELSRLLLAISVISKHQKSASCVIYDEIDAGTSGGVAQAIGVRLKKQSAKEQVLSITHLPQVAAQADQHIVIEKHSENAHAVTSLKVLSKSQRQQELARLLSGKTITHEAKKAAEELLKEAS